MDDYSIWWIIAICLLGTATVAGALTSYRTKPDKRMIGFILGFVCAVFTVINFLGSFALPDEVMGWGFVLTFLHLFLMILFGTVGWLIRRSWSDQRRPSRR